MTLHELLSMSDEEREIFFSTLPESQVQEWRKRLANATPVPEIERKDSFIEYETPPVNSAPLSNVDDNKKVWDVVGDTTSQFASRLTSLAGITAGIVDMGNMADPSQTSVKKGAITGAIQGAAGGAALGPIGMIGGALFGGISNALRAGNQRSSYEQEQERIRKNALTGMRVAPTMQEKGGFVGGSDVDIIPTLEEKGEVMLFPDGRLVDSMASMSHKDNRSSDPTDFIPNGSFVFSNSNKRLINLDKIKDDILTYTKGHYSEDGNVKGEKIVMGDIFGRKGNITPADAAKKIRKMFPITESPIEDYEVRTNIENRRRRAEYLKPIIDMQEGLYKKWKPDKVEKFELGGCGLGMRFDYVLGKCVPIISSPVKQAKIDAKIEDAAMLPGMPQRNNVVTPYATMEDYFKSILGGQNIDINSSNSNETIDRLSRLDKQKIQNGDNAVTEQASDDISGQKTPVLPRFKDRFNKDLTEDINPIFAENRSRIEDDYTKSVADATEQYATQRLQNIGILATKLAGIGAQNPNVEARQQGAEFVNDIFPNISESQIQSKISPLRKSQNQLLEAINSSGISGTSIGSSIASTQSKLIDAESKIRQDAVNSNLLQNSKRYEALNKIINSNRIAETEAENATRSNRNKLLSQYAETGAGYIKAQGALNQAISDRLAELRAWRQKNRNEMTQSEFNALMVREERDMRKKWFEEIKGMKESQRDELLKSLHDGKKF